MAATPMIMWKWPTTKYVSWKYRSSAGWPRKIPLSPPVTNSDTKPRANIMAVVKRILPPHKVAGKHAEDGGHAHDHVEVAHHEVGVVEIQIQCRLAQKDTAQPAGTGSV